MLLLVNVDLLSERVHPDNFFMLIIFMKSVSLIIKVYPKEIYLDFFCASTSYETNKRSLFTKVGKQ